MEDAARNVAVGGKHEALERVWGPTRGMNIAPFLRAALDGDADAVPPDVAAALAAWVELLDPEVEIDTSGVEMPGLRLQRGLEGMREMWRGWIEEWESYSWNPTNWADIGDHLISDVEIRATGRGSGAEVTWRHAQVFTFRQGKIVRWRILPDRDAALASIDAS